MKKRCFLALACLWHASLYSQMLVNTWDRFNDPGQGISARNLQNGFVYGVNPPGGEMIGTSFYDTTWTMGSFILYHDTTLYNDIPARYDILRNVIELKLRVGMRLLEGVRVNSFALQQGDFQRTIFVNTQNFATDEKLKGFFELVSNGKLTLLRHHKTWIKKPTYNAALAVGSRDTEIIREQRFYYARDGRAQKLTLSKKSLLELMADKKVAMEAYFKEQSPDLKDKARLTKLFDYYNGLK